MWLTLIVPDYEWWIWKEYQFIAWLISNIRTRLVSPLLASFMISQVYCSEIMNISYLCHNKFGFCFYLLSHLITTLPVHFLIIEENRNILGTGSPHFQIVIYFLLLYLATDWARIYRIGQLSQSSFWLPTRAKTGHIGWKHLAFSTFFWLVIH